MKWRGPSVSVLVGAGLDFSRRHGRRRRRAVLGGGGAGPGPFPSPPWSSTPHSTGRSRSRSRWWLAWGLAHPKGRWRTPSSSSSLPDLLTSPRRRFKVPGGGAGGTGTPGAHRRPVAPAPPARADAAPRGPRPEMPPGQVAPAPHPQGVRGRGSRRAARGTGRCRGGGGGGGATHAPRRCTRPPSRPPPAERGWVRPPSPSRVRDTTSSSGNLCLLVGGSQGFLHFTHRPSELVIGQPGQRTRLPRSSVRQETRGRPPPLVEGGLSNCNRSLTYCADSHHLCPLKVPPLHCSS